MNANPPKKPHSRVGQRLDRISQHFLSESQPREFSSNEPASSEHPSSQSQEHLLDDPVTGKRQPDASPPSLQCLVISDTHTQPFPTLMFAGLLAQHGVNCEVHQSGQNTINILSQAPRHTNIYADNSSHHNEPLTVQIYNGHDIEALALTAPYILLLPTPATATGIRHSFLQLKRHLHVATPFRTGVTITGTNDQTLARRSYSYLHHACQRFLTGDAAHNLVSYGLVDHNSHHNPTPELTGIARLIYHDCLELSYQRHLLTAETPPITTRHHGE